MADAAFAGCRIDHLVVTATSLAAGVAWVEQQLGVAMQAGGAHAAMATHNRLLRLGDTAYLEVIATDPLAPEPDQARWFGLDLLEPGAPARLRNWVASTGDIAATLAQAGEPLGAVQAMQRGDLHWRISVPEAGKPLLGGLAPALIQWSGTQHPVQRLPDQGLRLDRLELLHPRPHRVMALLEAIGVEGPVAVRHAPDGSGASLVAWIHTPRGLRSLSQQVS